MDGRLSTDGLSSVLVTKQKLELAYQCNWFEVNLTVRLKTMCILMKNGMYAPVQ